MAFRACEGDIKEIELAWEQRRKTLLLIVIEGTTRPNPRSSGDGADSSGDGRKPLPTLFQPL